MKRVIPAVLALAWAAQPAWSADGFDAAAAFGAREAITDASLSPDGQLLAFVQSDPSNRSLVAVVPVAGGTPRTIMRSAANQRLTGCNWTGSTRLACRLYAVDDNGITKLGFTRMFAVNADGSDMRPLTANVSNRALGVVQDGGTIIDFLPDAAGANVLMTKAVVREDQTGTRMAEDRQGLAVERLDTVTMKRTLVEAPRPNVVEYITDGRGTVRIMGDRPTKADYSADLINYCFRPKDSRDCQRLSTVTEAGGFNPYAVDRDLDVAYGFDKQDGRLALFKIALDGTLKRELVLGDPNVDVDGLIRIGRQRRVVGASFATERRQTVMFDPVLRKLAAALAKALPNLPQVAFIDASSDESKLLLIASSDNDPGRYFLYDKATRELNELVSARPQLAGVKLATVKPVTFPAADGTPIPGYLTLPPGSDGKNVPAIVMPHGGPGARDEWGFDWWAQYFANRGFAVLQPNFRGSTGYGDAWFKDNGFKSWRTAVGDVNDGGRWLLSQGIAAPGKLAIVGWSYGGYAALQSAALDPDLFKAIIAVAPVTDLETLRNEARNYSNFPAVNAYIGSGPHVREGSPAQTAARIKAPVLMFHGVQDLNVGVGESRLMEARLRAAEKSVELVVYPELDHQLEDSQARTDMLRKSDTFLRKSLGL